MEKIYATGYDHDVKSQVLYAKYEGQVESTLLYIDKECTVGAGADLVKRLFLTGGLIVRSDNDGKYYRPNVLIDTDGEYTHVAIDIGDEFLNTFYSAEYHW